MNKKEDHSIEYVVSGAGLSGLLTAAGLKQKGIEVLLVDVSISAFSPIMIAAATGALVSEIALDESILLNFKQEYI